MCNLYRMSASRSEVAAFFDTFADGSNDNTPEDIYPGYPGLVLAEGQVRQMVWGFPLHRKGAKGQPLKPRPVNNTRSENFDSPFWRDSYRKRRCLIPVSAFAEMEGEKGRMTRVWFSPPGDDLFAIAGIWRDTGEWGAAYSMIMTDACIPVSGVHDRMPAIIARSDWPDWLSGEPDAACLLCRPYENLEAFHEGQPKLL